MRDEWGFVYWYTFWGGCVPIQLSPVSPGQFQCFRRPVFHGFSVYTGFFSFLGDLDETWDLHPLVCIVHSGLLIWTKGVLQGVSGGALWVVR